MSEELVALTEIQCPRCGQKKPADARNPHICVDCAKAENNRYMHIRQHQGDWIEEAKSAGIDVWLQQPGETQWEYTIWCTYRDAYPGRRPSYRMVAEQLNTTVNVVEKAAQRWSFQARMQIWMAECDRITMQQRHQEILDMNKDHIDMAARLRSKISTAIDCINPEALKPGELATLLRLAADLERKAHVDDLAQEEMLRELSRDTENPALKKSPTKHDDLGEVVKILMDAGALGNITQIGVRETTTTVRETVAVDNNGAAASIVQEQEE